MHRIDTAHAETDANGAGKDGFNDGEPGVLGKTELDAAMMNGVQENICQAVEAAGITLVKGTHTQLLAAIKALADVQNACARYTISGSGVTTTGKFTLASDFADTGYVLASNEVQVPSAGKYLISGVAFVTNTGTGNPEACYLYMNVGGTDYRFVAYRFSATNTNHALVAFSVVVSITTPGSEKISFQTDDTFGGTEGILTGAASDNKISIVRVRD